MLVIFLGLTIYMGIEKNTNLQILFSTLAICEMVALVGEHIIDELKKKN